MQSYRTAFPEMEYPGLRPASHGPFSGRLMRIFLGPDAIAAFSRVYSSMQGDSNR